MPTIELHLSDLAIEQINELFDFHDKYTPGKGSNFLEVLWDCMDTIQENPRRWQYLGSPEDLIRRAISTTPQTIILYAIEQEKVIVYEVYDSRQNWQKRH